MFTLYMMDLIIGGETELIKPVSDHRVVRAQGKVIQCQVNTYEAGVGSQGGFPEADSVEWALTDGKE